MSIVDFRRISYRKRGETLQAILRDEDYNKILDEKANIHNKKEMLELQIKMKQKGINFPTTWFD